MSEPNNAAARNARDMIAGPADGGNKRQRDAEQQAPGSELEVHKRDRLDAIIDHIAPEIDKQLVAHIPKDYFLRTVETGLRRSPALARIALHSEGRRSLYAAMLEAARWGLMPFTKDGAIVPFGKQAQFIPQWQGLVKTMYNSGMVTAVEARLIHQRDEWALAYGDQGGFYHRPALIDHEGNAVDRGPAVLAYCFVRLRDGNRTAVTTVTRQQAIETRDRYSRSYQNAETSWNGKPPTRDSAWHTDFDSQWIKTAVRRHFDVAPSSPELRDVMLAASRDDAQRPAAADATWTAEVVSDSFDDFSDPWSTDVDDLPPDAEQQPTVPPPYPPPPAPKRERSKIMRELHMRLSDGGLKGAKHTDAKLAVCAVLGRESPEAQPLSLKSFNDLSDEQLLSICAKLDALAKQSDGSERKPGDVHEDLLRLARAAGWVEPASAAAAKRDAAETVRQEREHAEDEQQ
jgi:phage RecT family recombinase